jgi:hypothetical protein
MSLGELSNLYRDRELDIHPEFQRFFRWSNLQKSRLIESVLLGIPVPSIFVYQREDGVWDVIDGLQRLSTVFQLMGELRDEDEQLLPASRLEGTRYLPSLEGKQWEAIDEAASLTDTQRRLIKRASLDLKIVTRESDPETPFELFQRLNSGGSQLSDQELRNSLLIMVDREFYFWLKSLQEFPGFQISVAPSDRAQEEQYDLELVLRFLSLSVADERRLRQVRDVAEFLTDTAVAMAKDTSLDRGGLEASFEATFGIIADAVAEDAFRRHDAAKGRFLGGFSVSAFEAVTTGIAGNLEAWQSMDRTERIAEIRERIESLWVDEKFRESAKGGVRASTRIPRIVPLGRELFRP